MSTFETNTTNTQYSKLETPLSSSDSSHVRGIAARFESGFSSTTSAGHKIPMSNSEKHHVSTSAPTSYAPQKSGFLEVPNFAKKDPISNIYGMNENSMIDLNLDHECCSAGTDTSNYDLTSSSTQIEDSEEETEKAHYVYLDRFKSILPFWSDMKNQNDALSYASPPERQEKIKDDVFRNIGILETKRENSLSKKFGRLFQDEVKKEDPTENKSPGKIGKFFNRFNASKSDSADSTSKEMVIKGASFEGSFEEFAFLTWYVTNAKHWSHYFKTVFGFDEIAYMGLETGSRDLIHRVVQNNNVIIRFTSAVKSPSNLDENVSEAAKEVLNFVFKHGDGISDIAFHVKSLESIHAFCVENGAKSLLDPMIEKDENGTVKISKISLLEDTTHTLIENIDYNGKFLPHYQNPGEYFETSSDSLSLLPAINLLRIDHCVQNCGWSQLNKMCDSYSKMMGFHQFWSVNEKDVYTEYSALRSVVMASENNKILMPINEPAEGLCKSQIEEFIEYYNGPGVQHVAISTDDLISTVRSLRKRGAEFIQVPDAYYSDLQERLKNSSMVLAESFSDIKNMGILVDFDETGYLLQLFTKPLSDRPTLFFEFIQRRNNDGFGAGNFKALFETLEGDQRLRGNLTERETS